MSHIKVEFAKLQEMGKECSAASKRILQAKEDFQSSINRLDWEVKSKANIRARAVKLSNRLNSIGMALPKYNSYVNMAYSSYVELDNYKNGLNELGDVTPYASNTSINVPPANIGDEDKKQTLLEKIIDKIADFMKYIDNYSDKETGVLADICALISTTLEIGREGVKSVKELISFVSQIISGGIDLLTNFLDEKNANGFGIAATILSMCSEILDLQQKGIGQALQDSGDLIGQLVGLLKKIINENELFEIIAGGVVYPIAAFGSVCTRYVGDLIEFAKDGIFSIQDFARTLLDSGLAGASTWIKLLTCGIIDIDVDNAGDNIMNACGSVHDYMERNNWPTWAKVVGSIVGAPVTLGIGIGNMLKGEGVAAVL